MEKSWWAENMDMSEWLSYWYPYICNYLGIGPEEDLESARLLNDIITNSRVDVQKNKKELKKMVFGKPVIVFGAGPSLDGDILNVLHENFLDKCVIIAADGATKALLNKQIIPKAIATDLDGDLESLMYACRSGSIMVILAHGDNKEKISGIVPELIKEGCKIVGTTQTEPFGVLENYGGFTDGDRGAYMGVEMGAEMIILAGFDLGEKIGRYSKKESQLGGIGHEMKLKKLKLAKELLTNLGKTGKIPVLNITSGGEEIPNVPKITTKQLKNMLN